MNLRHAVDRGAEPTDHRVAIGGVVARAAAIDAFPRERVALGRQRETAAGLRDAVQRVGHAVRGRRRDAPPRRRRSVAAALRSTGEQRRKLRLVHPHGGQPALDQLVVKRRRHHLTGRQQQHAALVQNRRGQVDARPQIVAPQRRVVGLGRRSDLRPGRVGRRTPGGFRSPRRGGSGGVGRRGSRRPAKGDRLRRRRLVGRGSSSSGPNRPPPPAVLRRPARPVPTPFRTRRRGRRRRTERRARRADLP